MSLEFVTKHCAVRLHYNVSNLCSNQETDVIWALVVSAKSIVTICSGDVLSHNKYRYFCFLLSDICKLCLFINTLACVINMAKLLPALSLYSYS